MKKKTKYTQIFFNNKYVKNVLNYTIIEYFLLIQFLYNFKTYEIIGSFSHIENQLIKS